MVHSAMVLRGRSRSLSGGASETTAGSPSGIELGSGAVLRDRTSSASDLISEGTISFQTPDPPVKVLAYYQAGLKRAGFQFPVLSRNGSADTLRVMKKSGRVTVTVSIAPAPKGSETK